MQSFYVYSLNYDGCSVSWMSFLRQFILKKKQREIWREVPSCSSYDEVAKIHFKCILACSQNYSVQIPETTWQRKNTLLTPQPHTFAPVLSWPFLANQNQISWPSSSSPGSAHQQMQLIKSELQLEY